MDDGNVNDGAPTNDAPTSPKRTRKASTGSKAPAAFTNAGNAATAARALGIMDGKTFRARVRVLIGRQNDAPAHGVWAKYWTPANARKVFADPSIQRQRVKASASKKRSK